MLRPQGFTTLTPEARAKIERELRAVIALAREHARRRRFDWHTLELERYRVALRVQRHRLGWPLQLLVAARGPVPRAAVETLAEIAGIRFYSTDHLPGNQTLITEHQLKSEARHATAQPHHRPADATPSA